MKILRILAVFLASATLLAWTVPAFAATPFLTVTGQGNGVVQLQVSNADQFANITLYRRQTTTLWTVITNFGTTDASGSYTQTLSLGSDGTNNPVDQYVVVNGQQSSVVSTYPNGYNGGCTYNCGNPYTLSLSQNSLNLNVGQSTSVTVYSNGSGIYISGNTNSNIASYTLNGSQVTVYGSNNGSTTMTVCSNNGGCASLYVTVTGGCSFNCGSLSLSQTSISLSVGQSGSVTAYNANNSPIYISSNSNSNAVSASVSGNAISLYAANQGASTITVCSSALQCASLYVAVNGGYNSGSPYFSSGTMANMTVGQYYSYQFQASGGNAPYVFYVTGGNVPLGLTLSNSGQLYGTPQFAGTSTFTVRVSDNYGRTASQSFTITPSNGGSVLGSSVYNNGQLISVGGTVYIIYKNTQSAFSSAGAFLGLGFNWGQIMQVNYSSVPYSGYAVSTSQAAHPWGSWVKSGSTVYFVHELGLIPVGDYATFQNNGGQDRLVVQANSWDFQRPMLSVMAWNDARLR